MALKRSNVSRTRIRKIDCADAFMLQFNFVRQHWYCGFVRGKKFKHVFVSTVVWKWSTLIFEYSYRYLKDLGCFVIPLCVIGYQDTQPTLLHIVIWTGLVENTGGKKLNWIGIEGEETALPYSLTVTYTNPRGTGSFTIFLLDLIIFFRFH